MVTALRISLLPLILIWSGLSFTASSLAGEPEGYYGVGHDLWHDIYKGLHNQIGTHCCNNMDCRPTQAKRVNGAWYAMLNGVWTQLDDSRLVQEYGSSWSETAHICASAAGYVFCLVPPPAQG